MKDIVLRVEGTVKVSRDAQTVMHISNLREFNVHVAEPIYVQKEKPKGTEVK